MLYTVKSSALPPPSRSLRDRLKRTSPAVTDLLYVLVDPRGYPAVDHFACLLELLELWSTTAPATLAVVELGENGY